MRRSDERACDLAFDLESRELRQCPPIHCSVWTSGETGELWSRSCSVCRVCWLRVVSSSRLNLKKRSNTRINLVMGHFEFESAAKLPFRSQLPH